MRHQPSQILVPGLADGRFVHTGSPEFSSGSYLQHQDVGAQNGTWHGANDPFACSFALPAGGVVRQLCWFNGSAAGGNADIGVYDLSWNRLVSAGSTGAVTNSVWQFVNVTDTALPRGRYYLALARDNVTANRQTFFAHVNAVAAVAFMGGWTSTTDAFPLPNPLTNMVTSALSLIPLMGLVFRTPFV